MEMERRASFIWSRGEDITEGQGMDALMSAGMKNRFGAMIRRIVRQEGEGKRMMERNRKREIGRGTGIGKRRRRTMPIIQSTATTTMRMYGLLRRQGESLAAI